MCRLDQSRTATCSQIAPSLAIRLRRTQKLRRCYFQSREYRRSRTRQIYSPFWTATLTTTRILLSSSIYGSSFLYIEKAKNRQGDPWDSSTDRQNPVIRKRLSAPAIRTFFEIYKALHILYPDNELADRWIKLPNSNILFGGRPAVEFLAKAGIDGLYQVRRLLDSRREGWN